jgi:2-polyprenyl-3-methyl-5-hydroxy-6-metoxy-1,4-benzoquinol methylase
MLQHLEIDRPLLPALTQAAKGWRDMNELELRANRALAQLRAQRTASSRNYSPFARWQVALDDRLRTDQPEYLDDPAFPAARRVGIAHALHRFNRQVFAYRRFYLALRPTLRRLAAQLQRPVRVLELASGSGEFALALAEMARRDALPVKVTGSDYFPEHVDACRDKAAQRGAAITFREINAFDMSGLRAGEYDLVFIAQSLHHFSPGQIAMMIAQSMRVAATGFIGIDGQRSLSLYALVPTLGAVMRSPDFIHDAVISLRKFLTHGELELIARIAAPEGFVRVRGLNPGYSWLEVLA